MKTLLSILFLAFLTLVTPGCQDEGSEPHSAHKHEEASSNSHSEEEGHIELTPAQKTQLQIKTQAVTARSEQLLELRPGQIEGNPDRQVSIGSQVSGTLQDVRVQVGDRVQQGSVIATVTCPEVTTLQAEYHHAEVEAGLAERELHNKRALVRIGDDTRRPLENAKLEVARCTSRKQQAESRLEAAILQNTRLEQLLKEGIASRQQVEQSRAARRVLEAELQEAETALAISQRHLKREQGVDRSELRAKSETFPAEARLARATEEMRHSRERLVQLGADPEGHEGLVRLLSPIEGIVTERSLTRGSFVAPGERIALVVNPNEMWVWLDLQAKDLDSVKLGDPLRLHLLSQAQASAEGFLDYIAPQVQKESQTYKARVVLSQAPPQFHLGSYVNAQIVLGGGQVGPAVPSRALQVVEAQTVVYRVKGDGFERTPVTVGAKLPEGYLQVSGLELGDEIAVSGVSQLKSLDLSDQIGGHHH